MRRPTPETLARSPRPETLEKRVKRVAEAVGQPVRSARISPEGEIFLEFGQADETNPFELVDYGKARSA